MYSQLTWRNAHMCSSGQLAQPAPTHKRTPKLLREKTAPEITPALDLALSYVTHTGFPRGLRNAEHFNWPLNFDCSTCPTALPLHKIFFLPKPCNLLHPWTWWSWLWWSGTWWHGHHEHGHGGHIQVADLPSPRSVCGEALKRFYSKQDFVMTLNWI